MSWMVQVDEPSEVERFGDFVRVTSQASVPRISLAARAVAAYIGSVPYYIHIH